MRYLYNPKIFIILFIILGVFILFIILYPFNRQVKRSQEQELKLLPTPTKFIIVPTQTNPQNTEKRINITPRFTGVNEDIPQPTLNAAMQKQTLKKKTPLTENGFVVTYDYQSDNFVVTLSEPKQDNKLVFEQWLKQNHSLLTLNKFLFK